MDSQDRRSKRQKLQDMANQTESPNEAEIARKKLEELPEEIKTFTQKEVTFEFTANVHPDGMDFFTKWARTREAQAIYVYDYKNEKWIVHYPEEFKPSGT